MKKNRLFMTGMAALLLSFGLILAGCDNPAGPDDPGDDNTAKDKVVSALTLGGLVTAPVRDAQPVTTSIDTTQYTGTIAWQTENGTAHSSAFAAETVYQAVLTLTVKKGFTFTGLAADSFSYTGATSVKNAADSGTVTITFKATAAEGADTPVTALTLDGLVTAPVRDAQPVTTAIDTGQYTGTVVWQTGDGTAHSGTFAASTVYKAVLSLTVMEDEFTFDGLTADSFSYTGATSVTFAADSGTVTITFKATAAAGTNPGPGGDGGDDDPVTPQAEMVRLNGGQITGSGSDGVFIARRTVSLGAFSIAKYETTYELWYTVKKWAADNNKGYTFANAGREGDDGTEGAAPTEGAKTEPVTTISWRDAIVWCNAYSEMSGKDPVYYTDDNYGTVLKTSTNDNRLDTAADKAVMKPGANGYRLPTEAEWEYAARGGDQSTANWGYTYAGSDTVGDVAWYKVNAYNVGSGSPDYGTHPVGEKTANAAGLYDMSGNVQEWCWDWYDDEKISSSTPATGVTSGWRRVGRGGSWYNEESDCTVAYRSPGGGVGFRVVGQSTDGTPVTPGDTTGLAPTTSTTWTQDEGYYLETLTFNADGTWSKKDSSAYGSAVKNGTHSGLILSGGGSSGSYTATATISGNTLTITWESGNRTGATEVAGTWTRKPGPGPGDDGVGSLPITVEGAHYTLKLIPGGTVTADIGNSGGPFYSAGTTPVTVNAFYIGEIEITYRLWKAVYGWATHANRGTAKYTFANAGREGNDGTIGAAPTGGAKPEPVTDINWRDAIVWCNAYSEMSGKEPVYYTDDNYTTVLRTSTNTKGVNTAADKAVMKPGANGYRLPTEAEWEYAARGGVPSTTTPWTYIYAGTGNPYSLENYAWYNIYATYPVGTKTANTAGLYDMSGNVWEWCWDSTDSGAVRVYRGGSESDEELYCRVAYQGGGYPNDRYSNVGFRVVCKAE